jgi:hypothetical protein
MAVEDSDARPRRNILAAGLGALGGLCVTALGAPAATRASAGDPLIVGRANDGGIAQTTLQNAGFGAAFTLKTTNTAAGATGLFGWSSSTGAAATRGVYGRADGADSFGVEARSSASSKGTGAALQAIGGRNNGVQASTGQSTSYAVHGVNTSEFGIGIFGASGRIGVWGSARGDGPDGIGVLGSAGNGIGVAGHSSGDFGQGTGVEGRGFFGDTGVLAHSDWGTGLVAHSDDGYAAVFEGHVRHQEYVDVTQIVTPASPDATMARLFVREEGGKAQLCVLFASGAVQVLAAQV